MSIPMPWYATSIFLKHRPFKARHTVPKKYISDNKKKHFYVSLLLQ
jgi:hypothetical protein